MRPQPSLLSVAAMILIVPGVLAQDSQPSGNLESTRATLKKWVETQQAISRERQEWQLGKDVLQQRIDLLQGEVQALEAKVAQVDQLTVDSDKKRAELVAEQSRLAAGSTGLGELVVQLEKRLTALEPSFPEPLRDRIRPLFRRLPTGAVPQDLTLGQRFQNVIGILNEANKFNSNVTVVSEVRELPDGGSAEVKTIYLGLAQGFYVTPSDEAAGVGVPSRDGWRWTANDGIAGEVSRAIGILESGAVPAYVSLPLTIE